MSNTDLYNLVDDKSFDTKDLNERYAEGLVDLEMDSKTNEILRKSQSKSR